MIITNIPRRKIYEILQEYEDSMVEFYTILFNEKNFKEMQESYKNHLKKIQESYKETKSLLPIFFEHKIFEKEEEFEQELDYWKTNKKEREEYLQKSKNLTKKNKQTIKNLNQKIEENNENKKTKNNTNNTYKNAKELYELLDKFNKHIPEILLIKRTNIK